MAKKRKLKKGVWIILVLVIFVSIGIYAGINIYKNYKYEQTYEFKLLELGYEKDEVDTLLENFDTEEEYNYLLNIEKNSDIIALLNEKYYLEKNFKDYLSYMKDNKGKSLSEVVRDINIHLNYDFYELDLNTDTSLDYKMLVNKYYRLDSSYSPDDLVTVTQSYSWGDYGSKKVRKVAYEAFLEMWNSAKEDGYYLMINSAYREYSTQEEVYNDYKNSRGEKYADSIAARPGSSEHETGLAIDIFSKNNSNKSTFKDSEEAKWLAENSYKFGFILRYPEDKVNVTGYGYESWHFRYVGVDAATYCFNNDITYEEYYAYFIED